MWLNQYSPTLSHLITSEETGPSRTSHGVHYHSFRDPMWVLGVAISSGLSYAPCMVMVKTMVAIAMMEVNLVLLSVERGNIGGEKEGGSRCRDG